MVFEVVAGRRYIYQPPAIEQSYGGKVSRCTYAESVSFMRSTDSDYLFRRADGSILSLKSLVYVFNYQY